MDDLHKALSDIRIMRRQMALTTEFRGYGPVALAMTGAMAFAASWVQARWVQEPSVHLTLYVLVWVCTAVLAACLIAAHAITRSERMHSGMADEMIRVAAGQFAPCAAVGAAVTYVFLHSVPGVAWMLPGLWQILAGLGIFASIRFMPKAIAAAGAWYLVAGIAALTWGDARALAPLVMGVGFGVGQLLMASILFATAKEAE